MAVFVGTDTVLPANFPMTCSVAMPMDAGMLQIASSPPLFGHSFLSQHYMSSNRHPRPPSLRFESKMTSAPIPNKCLRPCLVNKSEITSPIESPPMSPGPLSPTKLKKKVIFADDKGKPLAQIRVMTEPSDCPPKWNSAFLAQVTHGVSVQASSDRWELEFVQPAADYFGFKKRLESLNVCLENVFVNDTASKVSGTVKVKNLSFHKEVNIRVTFDNWKSYRDCQAAYVPVQAFPDIPHFLDTFSFSFDISKDATVDKLEFCVQFKSEGMEFWDNNQGKNYTIRKVLQRRRKPPPIVNVKKQERPNNHVTCNDPLLMNLESWSEFASWSHLDIAGPYW
ncbi:protein phosphatase 1 regulatory subunit 3B-like isoform X2 [Artemia franciscana]|uniref:Protein phosphatase 1 regulatory subunit n=1 Tax=Artemia franciscana TaxID=6661 RepID=A0AA88HWA2_ARTSF|nr:hypothetical protein QYM36_010931 [Artemia franciscana]